MKLMRDGNQIRLDEYQHEIEVLEGILEHYRHGMRTMSGIELVDDTEASIARIGAQIAWYKKISS